MDITKFLGCFTPDELKDKNKTYMNENNRPKDFLFVLKDKGTKNQGWWLKISSADELCAYYEKIVPTRCGKVFENYLYGKEWNWAHLSFKNTEHSKYLGEAEITEAVVRWGSERNLNIIQSIKGFQMMVAEQQLDTIHECGAIYINPVGGYHGYSGDKEYAFVRRKDIIFPDFKRHQIRVKSFPGGDHFYAYIGDMQVRDGDILKWDTYDEAYNQALSILDENEKETDFERDI